MGNLKFKKDYQKGIVSGIPGKILSSGKEMVNFVEYF